jgi:hypothetical protein
MSLQWYPQYGDPDPVFDKENSFKWKPEHEPHYILRDNEGTLSGGYSALKDKKLRIDFKVKTVEVEPDKTLRLYSTNCEDWQDKRARACLMIRNSPSVYDHWNRAFYSIRPQMEPSQVVGEVREYFIEAPLNGNGWGFVMAGSGVEEGHLDEWKTMLNTVNEIALTFNGCDSAGHGAFVKNGQIRFTITSVAVI